MKELYEVQKSLSVPKNKTPTGGAQYSYRTVDDILEAVKKIIPEGCIITLSDEIHCIGDRNYISSVATFTKGEESVRSTGHAWEPDKLAAMQKPQITGSCSSYARKAALCGLLMIDDAKDVDSLSETETKEPAAPKMATAEQREKLIDAAVNLETSDPAKSDYISKQVDRHNLEFSKAAEIIRKLKA